MFWNLSTHEGGKSNPALNAFIDVDFNNKDILQYASKKLKNKFTQIVIPELVLDYVKWGFPEFKLWHDMLADSGVLTFADLNLSYITPQIQKVSNDVATIDMINSLNGFHRSYTEREEFLANTYPTHTYQRQNRPGFLTAVLPSFKASDKALDLSDLSPADNAKVTAYVKEYLELVNDAEYKDMDVETAVSKIHNKARFDFPHLRPLTMQHFFNKVPFYTEDQARGYLEREVAINDINEKISSIFSTARHNYLKREFGQIFSEVRFEDNDKSNTAFSDIPSTSMKRGNRLVYLQK